MSIIFTSQVVQKLYGLPLFSYFTDSLHLNKTKPQKNDIKYKIHSGRKEFFLETRNVKKTKTEGFVDHLSFEAVLKHVGPRQAPGGLRPRPVKHSEENIW